MPPSSPIRKRGRKPWAKDRRGASATDVGADSLRRLNGLLHRPLGLRRRGGRLRLVLIDRRRASSADAWLPQLRDELAARLQTQEPDHAAQVMRHLVFVHDTLLDKGWDAVRALPAAVLDKAIAQAEMLASDEPSPWLKLFVERLRPLRRAAAERDERIALSRGLMFGELVEVSEATAEEFDEVERSWIGVLPAAIGPSDGDR